jgi:hypothetical protein
MNATRYLPKDLRKMTLAQLAEVGEPLGLVFTKNHNKQERATRILAAYAAGDVVPAEDSPSTTAGPPHTDPGGPKPNFERLIDGDTLEDEDATQTASRGGSRPGAGRPEGMTDEIAAYNRLSKQPHPAVKMAVEKLFDIWATRTDCPEIRLSKEEAVALALPWTHAYELSPLSGKIPPGVMVVLTCLWTTAMIVDGKARLAREHRRPRTIPTESLN